MTDTVKLIIEIPKRDYEEIKKVGVFTFPHLSKAIREATPLYRNSKLAKMQSYFAGMDDGWECGRNALIDDIKAEINEEREFARDDFPQYKIDVLGVDPETVDDEYPNDEFHEGMERVIEIIDSIGKGDNE